MMYRTEHPKPQWERNQWMNLNGLWDFKFDHGNSGEARKLYSSDASYSQQINVPFCPESVLSGIGYTGFIRQCFYKKSFTVPAEWKNKRIWLNFGGSNPTTEIWLNGELIGEHHSPLVPFGFDITERVDFDGENILTVRIILIQCENSLCVKIIRGQNPVKITKIYIRKCQEYNNEKNFSSNCRMG